MPFNNPTRAAFCVAFIALSLLSACGKSAPDAPTPPAKIAAPAAPASADQAPQATPAPAPAATTFRVTAVTLGHAVDDANRITQPGTRFTPGEQTIYASVASVGVTRDTALSARWNYLEGAGQLITSVTQHLATDGPATTTFTMQNPDLWPEGKYNVEISVDGKPAATQAFEIDKAVK